MRKLIGDASLPGCDSVRSKPRPAGAVFDGQARPTELTFPAGRVTLDSTSFCLRTIRGFDPEELIFRQATTTVTFWSGLSAEFPKRKAYARNPAG